VRSFSEEYSSSSGQMGDRTWQQSRTRCSLCMVLRHRWVAHTGLEPSCLESQIASPTRVVVSPARSASNRWKSATEAGGTALCASGRLPPSAARDPAHGRASLPAGPHG